MKKTLFAAAVILLAVFAQAWADGSPAPSTAAKVSPDTWKFCKDRFEVKYDKFKDQTTIQPKSLRSGPEVQSQNGDKVLFWMTASYPGQTYDPKKPVQISLVFFRLDVSQVKREEIKEQHTGEYKYQDCSNLILMVDGQKMDFGTLKYTAKNSWDDFTGYEYIDQSMTGSVTLDQLKAMAGAQKIEGELCETQLEFRKDEFCVLNTILNFLQ